MIAEVPLRITGRSVQCLNTPCNMARVQSCLAGLAKAELEGFGRSARSITERTEVTYACGDVKAKNKPIYE
jgi:hypothetical protein